MSVIEQAVLDSHDFPVDSFGRPVRSLRLSITQRCDLSCAHCHREGQTESDDEMTVDEISYVVRIATSLGVRKVKLTGGEPLLRNDIAEIVSAISPLVDEVSLTTNGSHLEDLAATLVDAGLRRVNVSLHSLDPSTYSSLCGVDITGKVVRGIEKALSSGLKPVKVNMVVMKGMNVDEIQDMMRFCGGLGAVLQLIELAADRECSAGDGFKERFYSLEEIERLLASKAVGTSTNELHRRRRYVVPIDNALATVEVVRPMHNTEFCSNCTRIRMSSNGRLKPCLLDSSGEVDVLTPMRSGASEEHLKKLFLKAISNRKPYWS